MLTLEIESFLLDNYDVNQFSKELDNKIQDIYKFFKIEKSELTNEDIFYTLHEELFNQYSFTQYIHFDFTKYHTIQTIYNSIGLKNINNLNDINKLLLSKTLPYSTESLIFGKDTKSLILRELVDLLYFNEMFTEDDEDDSILIHTYI
jgi:hypothetical protein